MNKLILFLLCSLSLYCGKEQTQSTQPKQDAPKPDYSTPDKLIQSLWAFVIWKDSTSQTDTSSYEFFTADVRTKLWQAYRRSRDELKSNHYMLQNVVDKVSVESESRSVVKTKEKDSGRQEGFSERKYVLTKEGSNWKVEDVLELCWNCKGEGETRDNLAEYPSSFRKTCQYCDGLGWMSKLLPKSN